MWEFADLDHRDEGTFMADGADGMSCFVFF